MHLFDIHILYDITLDHSYGFQLMHWNWGITLIAICDTTYYNACMIEGPK